MYEFELEAVFDEKAAEIAQNRWDSLAKPIGSMGLLEDVIIKIAGLTGNPNVQINKRAVAVFCADNAVTAHGVTQTSSDVTAVVTENIAEGKASVNRMAKLCNTEVFAIDVGVLSDLKSPKIINKKIAYGTRDMTKEPAMTIEETKKAVLIGVDTVKSLKEKGYDIILAGEMGIGNTVTSSAVASTLLNVDATEVTGRGAGLSDDGLTRKIAAIKIAQRINQPNREDVIDTLSKVGGFDIAALTGIFLGGARYQVPIVLDGFISSVAALCAYKLLPDCKNAMIASHMSAEPAAKMILEALGLKPIITAQMRLGEGTGAVAAMPLIDMALELYHNMDSFEDISITRYQKF